MTSSSGASGLGGGLVSSDERRRDEGDNTSRTIIGVGKHGRPGGENGGERVCVVLVKVVFLYKYYVRDESECVDVGCYAREASVTVIGVVIG